MLRDTLNEAMKTAMRAKDEITLGTVRLIRAALKDRDIDARGKGNADGSGEDEILSMMQGMIKQRRESIVLYEKGGRCELAQQEQAEIEVIQRFLPRQMDADETQAAVDQVIAATGAAGIKDMGRVMAALREQFAGKMDFARASDVVKARLVG